MASLNLHIIAGYIGKEPETRFTANGGVAKTTFSVATSERWKDKTTGEWKENTEWHNIVAWRKEWLQQSLSKGAFVVIVGKVTTRSYETSDGGKRYVTEVVADTIQVVNARRVERDEPTAHKHDTPSSGKRENTPQDLPLAELSDDDVPF